MAVDLVGGWLGRRGILTDQSATGLPDFTIAYTDGRSAVGEVTWHADPRVEQMWSVTLRQDTPQQVPLQAGEGIWGTQLVGAPNITRLHAHLPGPRRAPERRAHQPHRARRVPQRLASTPARRRGSRPITPPGLSGLIDGRPAAPGGPRVYTEERSAPDTR